MTHRLEADSILLQFGERKILSNIYIKSETGKITGLLGRNGQGKSCLMQIIYGSLSREKSVRFDGKTIHEVYKRPDLLLYLPQFNFIPTTLSLKRVFQDFCLDFEAFATAFPEYRERYKTPVGHLSGGGQRLVEVYAVAKAKSQFAMLDEPFSHLSPIQIEKIKELLQQEKAHKGFIVTDHMYRHVIDLCTDLYMLFDGKTYPIKNLEDIERHGYARL